MAILPLRKSDYLSLLHCGHDLHALQTEESGNGISTERRRLIKLGPGFIPGLIFFCAKSLNSTQIVQYCF